MGKPNDGKYINKIKIPTETNLYAICPSYLTDGTHTISLPTILNDCNILTDENVGTLVAGNNITITEDSGTVTISSTIPDATTSAAGLMTGADKTKLNGIATGAEVNQNAFANVVVGSTTIAADAKQDTLTLVAGANITLTPDATNDKITIAASGGGTGTDTYRPIQINGTQILDKTATTNSPLNIKAGTNITITNSGGTVTIANPKTTLYKHCITNSTNGGNVADFSLNVVVISPSNTAVTSLSTFKSLVTNANSQIMFVTGHKYGTNAAGHCYYECSDIVVSGSVVNVYNIGHVLMGTIDALACDGWTDTVSTWKY